jgi:hypothetical protein
LNIEEIASVCHEANRRFQRVLAEEVNATWEDAPDEMRKSVEDGVVNALDGASPRDSHANWLKFKEANGWVYGPEKDFEKKTHPCIVHYDDLPEEQKIKDHLFVAIVWSLAPLMYGEKRAEDGH